MNVFSVIGVCLTGAVAVLLTKELRREIVPVLLIGLGVTVFLTCLPWLSETVGFMKELAGYTDGIYTTPVLRALGIAYLTSVAAEICKSCGEQSVGTYVETAGKLGILALSVPLFRELFETALLK